MFIKWFLSAADLRTINNSGSPSNSNLTRLSSSSYVLATSFSASFVLYLPKDYLSLYYPHRFAQSVCADLKNLLFSPVRAWCYLRQIPKLYGYNRFLNLFHFDNFDSLDIYMYTTICAGTSLFPSQSGHPLNCIMISLKPRGKLHFPPTTICILGGW